MISFICGLILGLSVGFLFGIALMCFMFIAKNKKEEYDYCNKCSIKDEDFEQQIYSKFNEDGNDE